MLQLVDLHKSFGEQKVLDGLNLDIPTGKITVIIGPSGEGKSVLLKHIMLLLRPDSGKILLDNKNLLELDPHELQEMRKNFGMLFQHAALFDSMNIFDNVAFPLREHTQMSEQKIKERVQEVLDLVSLPNCENKLPDQLSGGMRKRVGLARAIALTPQILLYDEPTTGLDPLMTDSVNELICSTQKKLGVTSIVISHDIDATFAIADKIAMLHKGKVLLEGTEEDFKRTTHPFIKSFLSAGRKHLPH